MPYYVIHAGTALQKIATDGTVSTLALPSGVTVSDARRARFAILDRWIVVVNAVSRNIFIDAGNLIARLLNIDGPVTEPTVAVGAAGAVTGTFRYRFTHAIKSGDVVLVESPFSPESDPLTLADQQGTLSAIAVSTTTGVNARRIYRTTNGGAEYYLLAELNDNTTTGYTDNSTDYDLALLASVEPRGNAPGADATDRLRLITAWKDRLWASPADDPDGIRFTANREIYAWPERNGFTAKPAGEDEIGVTAFVPRRDELLVGKRTRLQKIIGDSLDTFQMITVAEGIGPVSQEATVVVRDVVYFLARDGFYEYGPSGLVSLSRDLVHPWFNTDTYFERSLFGDACAKWNPTYDVIDIHLAAVGSAVLDRWVHFDLKTRKWYGPHRTAAFTPSMAALGEDADEILVPLVGSEAGFLYTANRTTRTDDASAISLDLESKWHSANTPDIEKYWGELAIVSAVESTGSLTVTPKVGDPNAATTTAAMTHNLTTGRERLGRIGTGRYTQLRFTENTVGQDVEIIGYEIPFHELGRR